jgi:hypothetical protein
MMVSWFVLFTILSLTLTHIEAQQRCTYTPAGWLSRLSTTASLDTICGVDWFSLLNASRLAVTENQAWLVASQIYIGARLNQRATGFIEDIPVSVALLSVRASLDRACDNVSQWTLPSGKQLVLLDSFNHGGVSGAPACADEFNQSAAAAITLETYYYYNSNDMIVLRDPATNVTLINSLLPGKNATIYGLYCLLGVATIAFLLVLIRLVMALSAKHDYSWAKTKVVDDHTVTISLVTTGEGEEKNEPTVTLDLQEPTHIASSTVNQELMYDEEL